MVQSIEQGVAQTGAQGGSSQSDTPSRAAQGEKPQAEAAVATRAPRRGFGLGTFILGMIVGAIALFVVALVSVQVGY